MLIRPVNSAYHDFTKYSIMRLTERSVARVGRKGLSGAWCTACMALIVTAMRGPLVSAIEHVMGPGAPPIHAARFPEFPDETNERQ